MKYPPPRKVLFCNDINSSSPENAGTIRTPQEQSPAQSRQRYLILAFCCCNGEITNVTTGEKVERPPIWVMRQGELQFNPTTK